MCSSHRTHDVPVTATLDHGGLVEQGTHDELIARGGLYHQMHEVQTRQRKKKLALSLVAKTEATA